MKKETKLRLQIKEIEDIQEKANDPGDQILAALLKEELCKKFINEKYRKPKEL